MLLEEAVIAPKTGIHMYPENAKIFLRLNAIVCEQKQERPFFCLKSSGSFRDCSQCLMPTKHFVMDGNESSNDGSEDEVDIDANIYQMQTSLGTPKVARNVRATVWRQLVFARTREGFIQPVSNSVLTRCRNYLHRTSALELPQRLQQYMDWVQPRITFMTVSLTTDCTHWTWGSIVSCLTWLSSYSGLHPTTKVF